MSLGIKALAAGATILASVGFAPAVWAEEVDIDLLLVADVYVMKVDDARGGFSRAAAVAREMRAEGGNMLYIHAGDTISPSLFSGFDSGEHVIELLNMEPVDIFVPGNHEYDFGPDVFKERMNALQGTKLAANLRDEDGSTVDGFADTKMYDFDGVMVGVVGLTAGDSVEKSSPGYLQIGDAVSALAESSAALREEGADIVVAVSHSTWAVDQELIASGNADVVLSGDDHDLHVFFNGATAFAEPRSDAEQLVNVRLKVNVEMDEGERDVSWWPEFTVIDTASVTPPEDFATRVAELNAELDRELDVVVGTASTALDSRRAMVRSQETTMGNLIADGMRFATKSDVTITNGGGIRADREYEAGHEITRKDILSELPFGNVTVSLELSGQDILDALENGVQSYPETTGRFPQISGMNVVFDPSQEPGSRVQSVTIGGEPLDPAGTYSVATNDFMARGGDGYTMFAGKPMLVNLTDAKLMANDVMVYIRDQGTVAPEIEGRMTTTE
ncbi:bifunctional metallophosphatase/5'-nucleotidase [Cucumibacter marinus]|uniref:bifunctional metallophosphatase/5'-nucleotidase n=1 Tax=Cucumibacter marinus TaxID=1121252 RepID=UPI0003F5EF87|nr:5'-nucleotidase C-terminal domain-containing protein [Cucumibacter marinus]